MFGQYNATMLIGIKVIEFGFLVSTPKKITALDSLLITSAAILEEPGI